MSKVRALPDAVREELDRRLAASGFRHYAGLAEWLLEQGFEIHKSSIQRYGSRLERRLAAVQASTAAAKAIAEAAPDDGDLRSQAVISLMQTEIFNTMVDMQEAEQVDDVDARMKSFSRAARAVSELTRASVLQRRWKEEVRAKAEAAAKTVHSIAQRGGLSEAAASQIRAAILGIADGPGTRTAANGSAAP